MPIFGRSRHYPRIGDPNKVARSRNALVGRSLTAAGSLTASGFRIRHQDTDVMRRLIQPWQARSFNFYDQIGEIKYASQFYSRMLSPLKLIASEIDASGDIVETTNPEAIAALERIQDPGGGRTGLLGSYGRLMFLAGECYLFVSKDPDTGDEQWEMLSTDELRIQSGVYVRYMAPSMGAQEFRESRDEDDQEGAWVPVDDKTAVAYRLWQRHPRWSMLADSTMQGVLDLCEELVLLTQVVRARSRSRLAGSGLLLIDERISPPPMEAVPDEDPEEDPVISTLVNAMTTAIVDEGSASAIAPITLRVPVPESGKVSDLVHHLQLVDPTQLYPETGLRYECIKRIAIGLDMPPEILLGLEQSNHWTAWQVDEQTWKGHGQPKAQQLCDDLTSSYYRPYLRDVVGLADAEKYLIHYDASAIINHPDRTKDAKDLYDRRVIGKKALRVAAGFDEEDAPTEQERAEMVGVATHDSSLAWFGVPAVRGGQVETAPGDITGAPGSDPATGATGAADVTKGAPAAPEKATGAEAESGPAGPPDGGTSVVGSVRREIVIARVISATDLALLRAREVAGNRLKSLAKRDPESLSLISGTRPGEIPYVLGRERVRALRASEKDLVGGATELIEDACRMWSITDPKIAKAIIDTVEQYAARTLYDRQPPSLPASFSKYISGLILGEG